jgi:putative hydrolase of HD superfamily
MSSPSIESLLGMYRLKAEPRRGWLHRGIDTPESVADHSWGTALLCLLFAEQEGVDPGRAVQIALVHDLAEAVTGDIIVSSRQIAPEMALDDKARLEREAMDQLVDAGKVRRLWESYEAQSSHEARFVRDMDLLDMCLQALAYRRRDPDLHGLDEFLVSAEPRIVTATGRRLWQQALRAYEKAR